MSRYLDTSVLVAYYCPEELSEKAEKIVTSERGPFISSLTEVEFSSGVSRKVREGSLKRSEGELILAKFSTHLEENLYTRLSIESYHYKLARDWLSGLTIPLRTLDALHLAVAASKELTLATADGALARAAKALGIKSFYVK